jgi:hypothetical protein
VRVTGMLPPCAGVHACCSPSMLNTPNTAQLQLTFSCPFPPPARCRYPLSFSISAEACGDKQFGAQGQVPCVRCSGVGIGGASDCVLPVLRRQAERQRVQSNVRSVRRSASPAAGYRAE